jgi:OPA family glycerol-3-phosphate transporter-like MFS transporter 1/2
VRKPLALIIRLLNYLRPASIAFDILLLPVVVTFMLCLVPFLVIFSAFAPTLPVPFLIPLLALIGLLIGGPNNIVTSAVAADLSEHALIRGNAKALGTVTSIINGVGSILAALGLLAIGE